MQILIRPYDAGAVKAIEKAIREANIGANPNVDGTSIRLNMPALTRERRQELVKVLHKRLEDAKALHDQIFKAGIEAALGAGAVLNDHHGVGMRLAPYMPAQYGEGMAALKRAASHLSKTSPVYHQRYATRRGPQYGSEMKNARGLTHGRLSLVDIKII